jgi:hypothetical protein
VIAAGGWCGQDPLAIRRQVLGKAIAKAHGIPVEMVGADAVKEAWPEAYVDDILAAAKTEAFIASVTRDYAAATDREGKVYACQPADAASAEPLR